MIFLDIVTLYLSSPATNQAFTWLIEKKTFLPSIQIAQSMNGIIRTFNNREILNWLWKYSSIGREDAQVMISVCGLILLKS